MKEIFLFIWIYVKYIFLLVKSNLLFSIIQFYLLSLIDRK